jgi:hypothetical protein
VYESATRRRKKSIVMLGASLHFQERISFFFGNGHKKKTRVGEGEEKDNIMPYAKLRYFSLYNFQLFFRKRIFTLSCQSAPHREHSSESK